jgi:hypothetical protein
MEGAIVAKTAYMAEREIVLTRFARLETPKSAFFECFSLVGLD